MIGEEVSYGNYLRLIQQLDELVAIFENHPDTATREQAVALLSGLDMLHHEGLGRLAAALRGNGAGEMLERALHDPVVRTLFGLYGLADLELPEEPKPAAAPALVQLTVNGRQPRADWLEIAKTGDVPAGSVLAVEADGLSVLLVNPGDDIYAYRNSSPPTGLPLGEVWLEGGRIVCSPSGDRYDARSGHAADGSGEHLAVYPVAVRGSAVGVARERTSETTSTKEAL